MSDQTKVVEDKILTDQQKAEIFINDYQALCEKHQLRIVTTPVFKARDDGTFSVVLQTAVGKLPR